jgi:hypothetical protein
MYLCSVFAMTTPTSSGEHAGRKKTMRTRCAQVRDCRPCADGRLGPRKKTPQAAARRSIREKQVWERGSENGAALIFVRATRAGHGRAASPGIRDTAYTRPPRSPRVPPRRLTRHTTRLRARGLARPGHSGTRRRLAGAAPSVRSRRTRADGAGASRSGAAGSARSGPSSAPRRAPASTRAGRPRTGLRARTQSAHGRKRDGKGGGAHRARRQSARARGRPCSAGGRCCPRCARSP